MLLHIRWKDKEYHYYMNKGAYDHEEEIQVGLQIRYTNVCQVSESSQRQQEATTGT